MKKLNVAIIGQGRSGYDIHGKFFRSEANDKYNVVAVVDAIEERRKYAMEEYKNIDAAYADYHELFNRKDIDLVVNSTFSYMHAPISEDLLRHGFNVVCEKPFARNYEEGARVVRVAEESGKMLNVFQQSRLSPSFLKLREILDSGKLGKIYQIALSYSGFSRRWDWQTSMEFGGGSLRNSGPHPMDQALALLDFDKDIRIMSRMDSVNVSGDAEDYCKIMLNCPGKPLIDVEISCLDSYIPYVFRVSASNGCLTGTHKKFTYKYFDPEKQPLPELNLNPLVNPETGKPSYCGEKLEFTEVEEDIVGTGFDVAVKNYYDMIYAHLTEGKKMEINPYQVLRQLQVIDEIRAQNPLPVKVVIE